VALGDRLFDLLLLLAGGGELLLVFDGTVELGMAACGLSEPRLIELAV
jgi:hypothetical protein